jgi:hypothetical protein
MLVPGWHMQGLTTKDEIYANHKISITKIILFFYFSIFLLMYTYFTHHCSVSNAIDGQLKFYIFSNLILICSVDDFS